MNEFWHPDDVPFFRERTERKRPGKRRSLDRAREIANALSLPLRGGSTKRPLFLTIVGSKGKGTAATYASATAAAYGLKVGTLTSPGYRTHRERIRIDGVAIDAATYHELSMVMETVLGQTISEIDEDAFLSPTGAYTLAGVFHFLREQCDVIVMEAGMGGAHDEVSIFPADGVGILPVFGEHLGIIGDTIVDIATEKANVVDPNGSFVVIAHQSIPDITEHIKDVIGDLPSMWDPHTIAGIPFPPDILADNAAVGVTLAQTVILNRFPQLTCTSFDTRIFDSVRLPGRRTIAHHGATIFGCDSAINGIGVEHARAWFEELIGIPDLVLICIPDGKDREGVVKALGGLCVVPVQITAEHLKFANWNAPLPQFATVFEEPLPPKVLALGTISFIGEVLDVLNVDTTTIFRIPTARSISTRELYG